MAGTARMLRFDSMAQTLDVAQDLLAEVKAGKEVTPLDLEVVMQALDDLPALAWNDAAARRHEHPLEGDAKDLPPPLSAPSSRWRRRWPHSMRPTDISGSLNRRTPPACWSTKAGNWWASRSSKRWR